jgi:hypothetical protein
MKLLRPPVRQSLKLLVLVGASIAMAWLFYWLLPVAVQSRLSADHVRWAFGTDDIEPVAGQSLSSLWALCLMILHQLGLGVGGETFATAAALSGWISLAALVLLSFVVPVPAMILLVLTPAVLWTSIVPNGFALQFLLLALMAILSNPTVNFENSRKRWCLGAFVDGLACSLSPAAWLLVLLRAAHNRKDRAAATVRMRFVLFAVGFSLPMALGALLGSASFAPVPVWTSLRAIQFEDGLGAAFVFWGRGGETSIALAATLAVAIAITLGRSWRASSSFRFVTVSKWVFLVLPFVLMASLGNIRSWRLAHPGWNTVIEDFALNVDRSFPSTVIALVRTATEESAIRYADTLLAKKPHVIALRPLNLFEQSTIERVRARESKFGLDEARRAVDDPSGFADGSKPLNGFQAFVQYLIAPNIERGVRFWIDTLPDRDTGFEIRFLGNGYGVSSSTGRSQLLVEREDLKSSFVRSHVGFREFEAGPSIEVQIFARYAAYHLAAAKIISSEKRTADWENRARAEHYAALKKVEWLHDSYQKVCVEPMLKEKALGVKDSEPLDVCIETKEFHERK